ncbi:MAG: hypothetical protein UU72_C0023G0007 [candidate division WWE3 bacterium GW2011_GWB1_41_6]|uniref:Fido domain-containing protein n=1 Tax=candidate division WWE3 bacterium GW2011_GWB1_41_6 TaxID=1619112 RepID=A0A0G0WW24_UNCKA|nr:MAG: hypothetical protein UU72_C0023G0007 [candidate division WWE3 bacterium GW2011_GWB1_41_6]
MFIPEFTITNKILRNITQVEYSKALIENTPILSSWEKQLQKEARVRALQGSLVQIGLNVPQDYVKKYIEGLSEKNNIEMVKMNEVFDFIDEKRRSNDLHEEDIRNLYHILHSGSHQPSYRKNQSEGFVSPQEILSEMVQLIQPYDQKSTIISNLAARVILYTNGFEINRYYCLEEHYAQSQQRYMNKLDTIERDEGEMTEWLEYFTEGLAHEISNIKEKVMLLARDTKVAKVSGRVKLTERQERIVEYLQDYGILQNKDFARVFPGISEDSVLRDLKSLINKGLLVKSGSTKSSRYELG